MGPPLPMDGIAVYQELRATGKFEVMNLSVDEAEHSMEMHLPYLAKVFKGYVCVNPSFSWNVSVAIIGVSSSCAREEPAWESTEKRLWLFLSIAVISVSSGCVFFQTFLMMITDNVNRWWLCNVFAFWIWVTHQDLLADYFVGAQWRLSQFWWVTAQQRQKQCTGAYWRSTLTTLLTFSQCHQTSAIGASGTLALFCPGQNLQICICAQITVLLKGF